MERVSTLAQSTLLLAEFQRVQNELAKSQVQISTGKKGDSFQDVAQEASVLLAARRSSARIESFQRAADELANRLNLQDVALTSLESVAADLKQAVMEAAANGSGLALRERLEDAYSRAVSLLNTKIDGRYIFGGTRSDVAPVNAATLDELLAAPSVAAVFENNAVKPALTINEGQTAEFGQLASEVAADLFAVIRDIGLFDAGAGGPFGETLTAAQRSFLESQIGPASAAGQTITLATATNGIMQKAVADAQEQHGAMAAVLASFISDIEDVDMAEAVTRLNQAQVAAQASAQVLAQVRQLSLLDYLD